RERVNRRPTPGSTRCRIGLVAGIHSLSHRARRSHLLAGEIASDPRRGQKSVLELVVVPVPEEEVVVVGLMPMKTPEAGSGNGLELGVETTPAGGSPEVAWTTRSCCSRLLVEWSCVSLPNGSTTIPRKYFAGLVGRVTRGPVKVRELVIGLVVWLK